MYKRFLWVPFILIQLTARAQGYGYPVMPSPSPWPASPSVTLPTIDPMRGPKVLGPVIPSTPQWNEAQRQQQRRQQEEQLQEINRMDAVRRQSQADMYSDVHEIEVARATRENQVRSNKELAAAALAELSAMLEGRAPISLKRAVYVSENVYLNNAGVTYRAYALHIQQLARACRALMREAGQPDTDPTARLLALHQLMTDTINVNLSEKPEVQSFFEHYPYHYDFNDFWAREDYSKQFVTKLLTTNSGQCHSMPLLYKILAEELNLKAYLATAPQHFFIQVKDGQGKLYNYETTNGHFVSDS